jgi:NADH-quinone oxidoreductase subunit N
LRRRCSSSWGPSATAFGGLFIVDKFGVFFKVLVLAGSSLAIVMSMDYIEREGMSRFEFPVLMLLSTVGMLLMLSANDLISLYLGLELQSLALYVVAAFRRDDLRSTEAGMKYFVLARCPHAALRRVHGLRFTGDGLRRYCRLIPSH